MSSDRLSALDASFLAVEGPSSPMHVGWVATFDPPEAAPRPAFAELAGLAEAEAIAKRAEALEQESDAVIGQQLAEKLPEIVEAAAKSFSNVDNLTVLNGAQGIGEIMNQVIGQAGPALELARQALGTGRNGKDDKETANKGNPAP